MYPSKISEEEKILGYEICEITNPEQQGLFPSPTITVVIYPLGESDRIIKVNHPSLGIVYAHQRYGLYEFQDQENRTPDWKPVNTYWDPNEAIAKALMGFETMFPNRVPIFKKIPPSIT